MEQHDSFNRVYDATRDALVRWLVPRIRSADDLEDLMQEIYRKLYRRMTRHGSVREPEKYVFGIAKKELARYYRRRADRQCEEPLSDLLPDADLSPEDWAIYRIRTEEVWNLVRQEPLLSYQAFTLYYGYSVPTAEIAKELGLKEDAVRKRLSRTRTRIRRLLVETTNELPKGESHE